jgi:hypothetical protein
LRRFIGNHIEKNLTLHSSILQNGISYRVKYRFGKVLIVGKNEVAINTAQAL